MRRSRTSFTTALLLASLVPAAAAASIEGLEDLQPAAALRVALPEGEEAGEGGSPGAPAASANPEGAADSGFMASWDFYDWSGPPPTTPNWDGAQRDLLYFLGYQFGGVAILYTMPESISGWTEEDKDQYSAERWRDNVSNPHWDDDEWYVNYLLHPYWGAAYYVRARERGLGEGQALLFSAFNSALYEYGAEALFEPVSYTDLIVTPLFGWLLGEYVFVPWRERVRANPTGIGTGEKMLLTFTDPLGVLYGATDSALGLQTDFTIGPMRRSDAASLEPGASPRPPQPETAFASSRKETAWGMQWKVAW